MFGLKSPQMIARMIKPLLPKLNKALNSHELEEGESKVSIVLDITDTDVNIKLVALGSSDDGKRVEIKRIIKTFTEAELTGE